MSKELFLRRISFTQLAWFVQAVGVVGWQWTTQ